MLNSGIGYKGTGYKGRMYTFVNFILYVSFLLSVSSSVFAQTKTNLDIFYTLVDSSVKEFTSYIPETKDTIQLQLNLGEVYSIFNNRILASVYSSGKIVSEKKESTNINFIIDNAGVRYGEIFRDGFFGEYLIPRSISLKGNYLAQGNSAGFREFNYSFTDTIKYDDIKYVENQSYAFTTGAIPSEPFFSGLLEPVVAIGTAALAIILFFTIRSK